MNAKIDEELGKFTTEKAAVVAAVNANDVVLLLKPGGLCVWVAPFTAKYHLVPGDFFRYTLDGATAAEPAGAVVRRIAANA